MAFIRETSVKLEVMDTLMSVKQRFIVFFRATKNYKIILNLLSLGFALVFSCLLLTIAFVPEFSSKIDHFAVQKYSAYYQDKAQMALNGLSQGDSDLLLEILNSDFSDIQKGDRAYGYKRQLLKAWCEYLYSHKHYIELLSWAKQWFTLDERDVSALAYYYRALWLVEQNANALNKLKEAKENFPEHALLRMFVNEQ
jgi:hypothetical protein